MSVASSVRERRRAEAVHEIKAAALVQLAETGSAGLSLRAVARSLGMTVQSLYHYFDSRDTLLTALVRDAHHALADAVIEAADAAAGGTPLHRRLAATGAFRTWALTNRESFLLIYGTPVPGFEPPPEAGTGMAAYRLAAPFAEVVFAGWTPRQVAALPLPHGAESLATIVHTPPAGEPGLPPGGVLETLSPGALALFIELRARMHGLVVLELSGHLYPLQAHAEALFGAAMRRMSDEVDGLRPTAT